jgi:plasmid stabilization system protein ParE
MKVELHPKALTEYEEAAHYYARHQQGLDLRFINGEEKAMRAIGANPFQSPRIDEDVRRHLVRGFPFSLIYTLEPDYVLVIAVAHCSRRPGYWKGRL